MKGEIPWCLIIIVIIIIVIGIQKKLKSVWKMKGFRMGTLDLEVGVVKENGKREKGEETFGFFGHRTECVCRCACKDRIWRGLKFEVCWFGFLNTWSQNWK